MTKLNLTEASLLDASGELSRKTKQQLEGYLARHPAARAEYGFVQSAFALLRRLPRTELPADQQQAVSQRIKQGIHQVLRDREREERAARRWKMVYHAMAGAAGLAASLLIAASVFYVHYQAEQRRQADVARAEQSMRDYLGTGAINLTDYAFNDVASEIQSAVERQQSLVTSDSTRAAMQKLVDDLGMVTDPDTNAVDPGPM